MTLEELEKQCKQCTDCELCKTRTNVVFGSGSKKAKILFVGEGPGESEDLQGLPFVGRAGQLLDTFLTSVGMSRSEVYIANIVKCRPPNNRDPLQQEQEKCWKWLWAQIELLSPQLIVCLGRISAKYLIRPDFKVTVEHGVIYEREGSSIMGTYHPAALLRTPSLKPVAFEDYKKIAQIAGVE